MTATIAQKKMAYFSLTLSILVLTLLLSSSSYAEYGKKVLVKSGDPAAGTSGAIFNLSDWNSPVSIGIS
ncbi:MAG: hypothetical protein GY841_09235, partial [FCB group bacterium]|nr:hypothetical protein [FCB group bacterium]